MGHHGKLRNHKACESCGHYVEKRFCPECGQENVETRQPFHYLFTISIEDFIHYDSRFWTTIRYLLFSPAKLTKVYLSGKRNLYVPPVTLYIFISFITFFIPPMLPDKNGEKLELFHETINNEVQKDITINGKKFNKEKLEERVKHDFPKAIFLYMPVFAFWLWLFHSKKKWYYFDHGIFTLHYFSFVLLSILLYIVLQWAYSFFDLGRMGLVKFTHVIFSIAFFCYIVYYFFHSHRKIYQNTKAVSRLLCMLLVFINSLCMLIFLISYLLVETYISNPSLYKEIMTSIKNIH